MAARPVQIDKGSRFIVLAAICVVVAALYFAQEVLIPLALAVLFCFLLAPLVIRLQRLGLGRVPSVIVVVIAASGVVVGLGWVTTVQLINLADRLPEYRVEIVDKVRSFKGMFGGDGSGGVVDNLKNIAADVQKATTQPASQPATTQAAATAANPNPPQTDEEIPGAVEQIAADPVDAVAREAADAPPAVAPPIGSVQDNPLWVAITEPSGPIGQLGDVLGRILSPLATAGLVLVFVVFMLIQREDLRDRVIRLAGQGRLNVTTTALDDAASRISRYMLAQAIVNGTYGVAVAIGLWAIGELVADQPFPSFVLWGLLCAVLRFIPYVGPWIAAVFPITLSLAVFHGFTPFLVTVGMFVFIEVLSNNVMEPWLYGASTGMSTVAVLASAVFWTWLWGPIGLLLATPMTVCLVVLGKYVPQLQFLDILLGDEPVLSPPERLYQRLLAMDVEEATELAHSYLKETSLEHVYDDVLLPALAMAEQDRHRGRIDEDKESFIAQSMRDMIDELGDTARTMGERQAGADLREAAAANVAIAKGQVPADPVTGGNGKAKAAAPVTVNASPHERALLPKGCTVNVVSLPARDDGDDIANQMLVQLLALRGYCAHAIPVAALASEMVEAVEKRKADIVVVSALPPGAVSYSRYLCKRVHARYPDIAMAVGLWTLKGDLKKAKERITCAAAVQIATTLGDMLDTVHQMAQPMIVRQDAERMTNDPPMTKDERMTNEK